MALQLPIPVADDITLDAIVPADADQLVRWLNDPELYARTLRIPSPYTMQDAEQFLEIVSSLEKKHGHPVIFAIREKGQLIGGFGFEGLVYGHCAEIGYWLAKPYRGQGIMTQVVKTGCQFAQSEWKLVRITAHVFHFNAPSARVLENSGFQLEGQLAKRHRKGDDFIDSLLYALVQP